MKRRQAKKRRPAERRLKPARMGPPPAAGGRTRSPGELPPEGAERSFQDVEPEGFRDHPRSSVFAAEADPDVDDAIGGE